MCQKLETFLAECLVLTSSKQLKSPEKMKGNNVKFHFRKTKFTTLSKPKEE